MGYDLKLIKQSFFNIKEIIKDLKLCYLYSYNKKKEIKSIFIKLYEDKIFKKIAESEILNNRLFNVEKVDLYKKFIINMYQYLKSEEELDKAKDYLSELRLVIADENIINTKINKFNWLFISKTKKNKIIELYTKINNDNYEIVFSKSKDIISIMKEIDENTYETANDDFQLNKEKYRNLIYSIISTDDINKGKIPSIYSNMNLTTQRILDLTKLCEKDKKKIIENVNYLFAFGLAQEMTLIPVSEIKQLKLGIRTRLLEISGYKNYNDIFVASEDELAKITGISYDMAKIIKKVAEEKAYIINQNLKISVSSFYRDDIFNDLLKNVYYYQKKNEFINRLNNEKKMFEELTSKDLEIIKNLGSGEYWIFYSVVEKNDIKKSINKFKEAYLEYKKKIDNIFKEASNFDNNELDMDFIWNDFYSYPENYNNVFLNMSNGRISVNKYELSNNKSKGVSVTKRINDVNQPDRGYLNPNLFIVEEYESNNELSDSNAFSPNLIGLAVDYLTRFMLEKDPIKAFDISLQGAEIVNEIELANYLIAKIKGLDDLSIDSAVKLCGFDCVYRVGLSSYKPVDEIFPGRVVINDIREMVNRSLKFFEKNGPIIKFGFTFDGGYTSKIGYGDGDFMTNDTLWDFKTIKGKITSKHTLQLLIYYIMGLHSKYPEYKNIKYIGIFNPKLNKSYKYPVSELSDDLINIIEKEVIGY